MKWVLIFSFIGFSSPALAFQYSVDPATLLQSRILDLHEFSQQFRSWGYAPLSSLSLAHTGLPFDQVYINGDGTKMFSLKAGLAAPTSVEGRLMVDRSLGVVAFHFRYRDVPYLLLSLGVPTAELKQLVKPWLRPTARESSALWPLLTTPARAETCVPGTTVPPTRHLSSLSGHIEDESILRKIGQCGADAWSGLKNSAASTLDFFKKLATDPKALWQETKESMVALKSFVVNINDELKRAWSHLQGLSSEEKMKIACTLAGSLMMEGAQTALGGVGLAKVLPTLTAKLKSTVDLLANLGQLEKNGFKIPHKVQWTDEVIRCAL